MFTIMNIPIFAKNVQSQKKDRKLRIKKTRQIETKLDLHHIIITLLRITLF